MTEPEKIGIESEVLQYLADPPTLRARFRIVPAPGSEPLDEGDWRNVRVVARVFDPDRAQQGDFESPLAEGPDVAKAARTTWTPVDLPLPSMPFGGYSVTAKVFSADDRYRKGFEPSLCRVYRLSFGYFLHIDRQIIEDVYRGGYANPLAEEEIRREVRARRVIVTDGGRQLRARESEDRARVEFDEITPGGDG